MINFGPAGLIKNVMEINCFFHFELAVEQRMPFETPQYEDKNKVTPFPTVDKVPLHFFLRLSFDMLARTTKSTHLEQQSVLNMKQMSQLIRPAYISVPQTTKSLLN